MEMESDFRVADARPPWDTPVTPDELHSWLSEELGLSMPREGLIRGHQAPFDYLVHTFFEGRGSFGPDPIDSPADAVVWANRGGGKTFLGAVATLLDLVFKPGIEVRILGGSLDQAKRMHAHLRMLFEREQLAEMVDGKITDTRLKLRNRSQVELLSQSQTSVRGTRVQKLRCDEVELFDPDVWEAAQLTTRSMIIKTHDGVIVRVRGSIDALSTMHVPYGLMFGLVKESAGGRRRLFKWGVVDVLDRCESPHQCKRNNGECVLWPECAGRAKARDSAGGAPGHICVDDAIDLKLRVSSAMWESEMLCLRPSRTDTVLPEFDPRIHVLGQLSQLSCEPDDRSETGPTKTWIGGMDFGYRAPTVVLFACVNTEGVVFVVGEHVEAGMIVDEHIKAIENAPYPTPEWIGIDPAGRQRNDQTGLSTEQVMRKAGLVPRVRAMRIDEGLTLLRKRLEPASGPPTLFVHERCAKLVESLERYHYPADRPESVVPVKDGHDHAVDALRYMIANLDRPHHCAAGQY